MQKYVLQPFGDKKEWKIYGTVDSIEFIGSLSDCYAFIKLSGIKLTEVIFNY